MGGHLSSQLSGQRCKERADDANPLAVQSMIPLTRPYIDETDIAAVAAVLRSGMLVQGKQIEVFEAQVAERCGRRHGVAVANGTAALHLALAALDIGPGDEVICPDLSWPSPAHAIRLCNAVPLLVDVDLEQWNVEGDSLRQAITQRTRAIIVIDQFGNPVRRDELLAASDGLPIIEDAACAIGSSFGSTPCGSFGAVSCLSFHPRKILTTGEGGMCLTDDDQIAARLRVLRNHGQSSPGMFVEAAGNHRLTEFAAAMGMVQLSRVDMLVAERRQIAQRYEARLSERLSFQRAPEGMRPNHQTFGALLPAGTTTSERDAFVQRLRDAGVGAGLLSYALHLLPSLRHAAELAAQRGQRLTHAAEIAARGFALPLFVGISDAEIEQVIEVVQASL